MVQCKGFHTTAQSSLCTAYGNPQSTPLSASVTMKRPMKLPLISLVCLRATSTECGYLVYPW